MALKLALRLYLLLKQERDETMANSVSLGVKKKSFKSIRLAAEAAGIPYMTFYMRIRMGVKVTEAMKKPVRGYRRVKECATV